MKIKPYDIWMWVLLGVVGVISWWVNRERVESGFFTDGNWIFVDGLFYTLFSALVVGYVVAKVLNHKRTRKH